MSILSDQQKAEMREATRSTAFALSDDLKHIRNIVFCDSPSAGDLRRVSTLLRRILLDGDLRTVAGPRAEKISILAPQLKPFHHFNEREPINFFMGGSLKFPGGSVSNLYVGVNSMKGSEDLRPDELVALNVEQFIGQRVLCYRGRWVSRTAIIKYVVIAAHAAHSSDPKKDSDYEFLHELKHLAAIRVNEYGFPSVEFEEFVGTQWDPPLRHDRNRIDMALALLHSTARYMVNSPNIIDLERLIDDEHANL